METGVDHGAWSARTQPQVYRVLPVRL